MRTLDQNETDKVSGGDATSGRTHAGLLNFGGGSRMPVLLQAEAGECALACLAMVASFHGYRVSLAMLRHRFSTSLKGVTLSHLIAIAQQLHLTPRPLRLEFDELKALQTPCILHSELDHFVVLRTVTRTGVVLHDPAIGERRLTLQQVKGRFTGIAVELSRGPDFRRQREHPAIPLRTLAGKIEGLKRGLIRVFALALTLEVFSLIAPQFVQLVVDQVLADGDRDLLATLGVSFSVLLVLQIGVSALRGWVVTWLGSHFNMNWTGNVFQHLVRLPHSYFLKRHLGDIVSRFSAIDTIQQTLTTQFVSVVLDGLMSVLTLALLCVYSVPLTAITVAFLVVYAGLRTLYFRVFREANLSQIMVKARQQTSFLETVRGIQAVRLNNQEPMQTARYLNATADALNTSIKVQRLTLVFNAANGLASGAQRIAVLWLGAWLALRSAMSAGMLMAFVAYADQFTTRAGSLVDYLIQIRLLRLQGERLADVVLAPTEKFAEGIYAGPMPALGVELKSVSFRYADGDPWVLKDASLTLSPGESVALVGPSGAGKSTLARLILGLLDPTEGVMEVGGLDLRNLGKTRFRSKVGSVMQDDTLFAGSISDNISFFDENANPDAIEAAARAAELHDDIVAMPMGYHSLIGDMGSALSGGQQQRLFLARALYRRPELLVLDEATSHLDVERERTISRRLREMNITRLIIAHRPETIATADRVMFVGGGKIVEVTQRVAPPMTQVQ
jgi:ATP-binding cassette subfamily B protein RaxB